MAQRVDVQYIRFYTDGSAARKVAPVSDDRVTSRLPKQKKHKKTVIFVDPLAVLGLMASVCLVIMMVVGLVQYFTAQNQMQAMQSYVEQLSARNEALEAEYKAGYDLEQVEKHALAMGMVPKDQVPTVQIQVQTPQPQPTPEPTFWEQVGAFLTGLFA